MTGPAGEQLLRDGLRRLAEHAPPPRGSATAQRVLTGRRAQLRRAALWAATVLALGGVLAAVPATVSGLSPDPAADAPVRNGLAESLYDVPVRGSLADDGEFLAGVRAIPWRGPGGPPDGGVDPTEGSRRVLYAADVPGGSRWVLVMGRVGRELVHAWFTGPAGAAPGELVLAGGPARTPADQPLALLDATGATGPLVVVGRPGDRAGYSPSLDRDASGRLGRTYTELPVVDGVPLGEVVSPVAHGAGQVRARSDRASPSVVVPATVDDPPLVPVGPGAGQDAARYWAALRDCLVPRGFLVEPAPDGTGLRWSGGPAPAPDVGPLSSAEQAQNDAAVAHCLVKVAGR